MIALPPTVKVGPYRYRVVESAERIIELGSHINALPRGHSDHRLLEITVDPHEHDQAKAATLLHELLHCCLQTSGVAQGNEAEEIIEAMTGPLLQVIQDNPALVGALQEIE